MEENSIEGVLGVPSRASSQTIVLDRNVQYVCSFLFHIWSKFINLRFVAYIVVQ